jgi:hypothetical protein
MSALEPALAATHATPDAATELADKTYPSAPTATLTLSVPFDAIKSPFVVVGDKASNASVLVVCPVPPLAISTAPTKVWSAFHAAAPVALNVPSAGVEWVTLIVMPRI